MQNLNSAMPGASGPGGSSGGSADRDMVATRLSAFGEADQAFLRQALGDPRQDEALLEGITLYLDRAAGGRFLHTLKLEKTGEWLGREAPARLQIRLMELAKSSQHPAHQAFRAGVHRSGGLERAYPKA